MSRSSCEILRGEITRSRADHHGRRHRIARLARVDHQVERRKPEHRSQRERSRVACAKQCKQRKGKDRQVRQHIERDHLKPLAKQRQRESGARRILHDIFVCGRNQGVAGDPRHNVPFRIADRLQLVLEIVVVVENDVGIDAAKAVFLEQMRLPQIADVIIDAAAFAPARHRPDIARQHREQAEAAEEPENFHPAHVEPCLSASEPFPFRWNRNGALIFDLTRFLDANRSPLRWKTLCAAKARSNRALRQRQVAIGAAPSRTSAIRSRVPLVVSAGSAPAA